MKKVICISGKAQHGKTTVANLMKSCLEARDERVLITNYAGLVKYVCKAFFGWDGKKDDAGRALLQYVGTDIIRKKDPDYWVNFLLDMMAFFRDEWDYVIIDDCRFPNEIEEWELDDYDVIHIRVNRGVFNSPLTDKAKAHVSEHALDDVTPDFEIDNSGSISDLKDTVEHVVKWITGELTDDKYADMLIAAKNFVQHAMVKLKPEDVIGFFKAATKELDAL